MTSIKCRDWKDLPSVLARVSRFLGKDYSADDLERLRDHVSIENMRKNEAANDTELMIKLGLFKVKRKSLWFYRCYERSRFIFGYQLSDSNFMSKLKT